MFGKNCHLKTLLVLTGVVSLEQLHEYENQQEHMLIPDFYMDKVSDILILMEECNMKARN